MSHTPFIGKRIELVSMDPHFHDISIGLYEQQHQGKPVYLVHTYSHKEGTEKRINFVVETMKTFGGLESAGSHRKAMPRHIRYESTTRNRVVT
jgi:hypothetical protein